MTFENIQILVENLIKLDSKEVMRKFIDNLKVGRYKINYFDVEDLII